jgi:1-acyl-sn-glycerol-3-phosphate acyltransferase
MAANRVRGAQRSIHRRNLIYQLIYPYTRTFFFHYYGKVEVRGTENIPRKAPVIFAPNHQNALMDALIVLFSAPGDVVFLARADIFNKQLLAYILNSLKVLPVFRQRDGASELGKNVDIFDISVNVLKNKHYLCVMPEGNHGDQRKLRTIVKGIFRIAFQAQEVAESDPFVKIVPVGLDFGDYVKQNTTLFINYGKPIEISEYWKQYQENNARAINALKARLGDELGPMMIDIQNEEHYEGIYALKGIYNQNMRAEMGIPGSKLSDRFKADKELIARLEAIDAEATTAEVNTAEAASGEAAGEEAGQGHKDKLAPLMKKVLQYEEEVKKMNIRDWVVAEKGYSMARTFWRYLYLLLMAPFFLYGLINNAIAYFLPVRLVRNIKDLQFHASVKAGLGILVFFPLTYALQTLLVGLLTGPWWIWAAYLVSLFPMGKLSLWWYVRWKKTRRGAWFRRQLRRHREEAWGLVELRIEIIEETEALLKQA